MLERLTDLVVVVLKTNTHTPVRGMVVPSVTVTRMALWLEKEAPTPPVADFRLPACNICIREYDTLHIKTARHAHKCRITYESHAR